MRGSWLMVPTMLMAGSLQAQVMSGSAVKWSAAPPFLAKGAEFTVLEGDPGASGEFTIRLKLPDGYIIAPHWHPTDENVTVISGSALLGMGDQVDRAKSMKFMPGGFITAPANGHHYAVAVGPTVLQVHGRGPFAITYVKAADDPRGRGK